ncbi:DUF418 domain-containing protein [Aurantiacibacter poecillastricola]|uniref:DUF418 domain-containing protein n=1 Tax=Aurantiacibacter poecillastricola TaxID=3064385 RepID=UPI00273F4BE5|nr:DUF418 domain-containing protein [Aurantiacibacter sp. 219JJ12-13]MDP5260222.1 DUF418 domain-containing protein [Aurantiacibacter sp. 219JJ12-13]
MSVAGTALTAAPSSHRRIEALDALRGVAVCGIALMNVIAFAMPANAYLNPRVHGGTGPLETALWAIGFLLVEDKFRALFAMLFGAGVAILLGKAREGGDSRPVAANTARMVVLLLIGLAHATLLANNDVLRIYALCGLLLPIAATWPVKRLLWAAGLLVAGQLAVSGFYAWGWLEYWYRGASGMAVDPAPALVAEQTYGGDPAQVAAALEQGRGSFTERLDRRLDTLAIQARFIVASIPSALASMLLGMALWRCGLLAGEWEASRALRLTRRCALATTPVLAALAAWSILSGFDAIVTAANAIVLSAPFDIVLSVGYAALAMALFGGALAEHRVTRTFAAAGRLALTNYLATSVIFAAIFASWGLGLFGEVSRGPALLISLVPITAILLWSRPWLSPFRQGPAEWLWRSLARLKPLPLRRRPET